MTRDTIPQEREGPNEFTYLSQLEVTPSSWAATAVLALLLTKQAGNISSKLPSVRFTQSCLSLSGTISN